jgi:hypothetical protein
MEYMTAVGENAHRFTVFETAIANSALFFEDAMSGFAVHRGG